MEFWILFFLFAYNSNTYLRLPRVGDSIFHAYVIFHKEPQNGFFHVRHKKVWNVKRLEKKPNNTESNSTPVEFIRRLCCSTDAVKIVSERSTQGG